MDPQRLELCADQISRIVDYDFYTIKDDVFAYIDEAWGPHTIDRFIISRDLIPQHENPDLRNLKVT